MSLTPSTVDECAVARAQDAVSSALPWYAVQAEASITIALPGVVSWRRPRRRGREIAYPERYRRERDGWQLVVWASCQATSWRAPKDARYCVVVEACQKGRWDLDRVVTAVCDALQGGGAITEDSRVDVVHAERQRSAGGAAPTTRVTVYALPANGRRK